MLRVIVNNFYEMDILREIIKDDFDISNFYKDAQFPMKIILEYSEDFMRVPRFQSELSRQTRINETRLRVKEPLESRGIKVEEIGDVYEF